MPNLLRDVLHSASAATPTVQPDGAAHMLRFVVNCLREGHLCKNVEIVENPKPMLVTPVDYQRTLQLVFGC